MNSTITLRSMQADQSGIIDSISASGELGRRIRDMGLVPGTQVTIVGRAPLKDPVALRLRDFTLTLRNNEADLIMVNVNNSGENRQ
ncbi:ferrous iron transport protein A [Desulfomicrobium macestii]|uniref:Ferrous iron transport protein A n=2 Tax=Desulfomicrobium TaxID=898 RepID=A0A8G2C0L6_DESNO|nr:MULTISPECIES: FeoA family protein [Desulfomicrobium]MBE1427387.1 ferrous iron transport protein A [Desulfomicrobium macestii]SFL35536.1 ferrous iron transport protein A [Desulfomicrobium norvegicum]